MRELSAVGKGEYVYDYDNDILLFKVKDRDYLKSIDFGNLIVDIDKEGFATGLRVFDASLVFDLEKHALKSVKSFSFIATSESGLVSIKLKFVVISRNKQISCGQDFVREATGLEDSCVTSTV
jgi:hypothetical protein